MLLIATSFRQSGTHSCAFVIEFVLTGGLQAALQF